MKLKEKIFGREEGFIVPLFFIIFYCLERVSIFYWIRAIAKHRAEKKGLKDEPFVKTYIFPEIWAVGNVFYAIFAHYLAMNTTHKWLLYLLIAYSIERTLELFVYQVNVLFFHRLNPVFLKPEDKKPEKNKPEGYEIKDSTRTVILLIMNIVEYILHFAVVLAAVGSLECDPNMHLSLIESFKLFMSLGGLDDFKKEGILMSVAYIESMLGIFMNILCLARFIGILPGVKEKGFITEEK